jgi:PAS domain S-box-containing protein
MSDQTADIQSQKSAPVFRGSLVRTVILSLLIVALLPATIIGATSYVRFQNSIQTQTINQLSSLSQTNAFQIEQVNSTTKSAIIGFANSSQIINAFVEGNENPNYFLSSTTLNNYIDSTISSLSTNNVSAIYAVNPYGQVLLGSKANQIGALISNEKEIMNLIGTANSALIFNPDNNYPNQLILITAYTKQMQGQTSPVTFLFYSHPSAVSTALKNPGSYFTTANVYLVTSQQDIVSLNSVMQTPYLETFPETLQQSLLGMIQEAGGGKDFSYTNVNNDAVLSYIRPIDAIGATYVIEVPLQDVQAQLQQLLRFILILLAGAAVLAGVIAFVGARQIAVPLVDLSEKARKFANGDFSQKAVVNRGDEIGLLASSFNYMVTQLSTFYTSLEARVAERTEQLRTSSEIAMEAVSSPNTNEILQKVTQSIVSKLGFPYAAIYLADKNLKNVILTEDAAADSEEKLPERHLSLPIDATSLIGWSAANRQARLSQNVLNERPRLLPAPLLAATKSEIALPILIGDRLAGILDIQSPNVNAFDFESMPAFSTLTNQIAVGMRNIELLETTQLNLQETAALYSASRAITQAQTEKEVVSEINNLFAPSTYVCFTLNVVGDEVEVIDIADSQLSITDQSLLGMRIPFESALQSMNENEMVLIDNFQVLSDYSQLTAFFGRRGCQSLALLPVYEARQLTHLLAIGSREETPLSEPALQPYLNLAETVGNSLGKIHLSESLARRQKEIGLLQQSAVVKTIAERGTLSELHYQFRQAYGEDVGLCMALKNAAGLIEIPYYCAGGGEVLDIPAYAAENDLVSQIIESGESQNFENAANLNRFAIHSSEFQLSARAWLGIPLRANDQTIGALALFTSESEQAFPQGSQTVLELIANRFSNALTAQQLESNWKSAEQAYQSEKFLLDSLLDVLPDQVSVKDGRNVFQRLSKSLSHFLGKSAPVELIGTEDNFVYRPDSEQSEAETVQQLLAGQQTITNHKETWVGPEGKVHWMITSRIPLAESPEKEARLLSVSHEITDLVQVQQIAEQRAEQLLTTSEIASESTAGTMDVEVTLNRLVNLIKERFNFYHASIFLLDPLGKFATLRESTGEAGAQLKATGHKLAVGSPSIVGQATGKGQPVVIGDVTQEANYYANPLLPDTRSEMAIPMKIGEQVLGALDVQSTAFNAFSQEDINVLQILANQTAIAIQNEDLFSHTHETLERHRLLHKVTEANVETMTVEDAVRASMEVLHQAMPGEQITYFVVDQKDVLVTRATAGIANPDQTTRRIPFGRGVVGMVATSANPVMVADAQTNPAYQPQNFETNSILAVPVKFADELLGVINIESTTLAKFDENDQEFVATLAANMGAIITNIRLLEQVRDQVQRQQRLFEITSKIRRSVDMDTIMQTTINEIGSTLNVKRATIKISPNFEKSTGQKEQE